MSYYKYFPTPSDRMGALWTLDSIEGACVVEFGPAGTTHFAIEGLMNLNGDSKAKVFTTHISEHDLTFGVTKRLEDAIKEVDRNQSPKYIFVFNSSLTSIIGTDISSVCFELEDQVQAKLIPIETGGFLGDYTLGVRNILKLLAKEVVQTSVEKADVYNIIGGNVDEYNHRADIKEIKRMMKEAFDMDCHAVFSLNSHIDQIETASKAKLNIVIRSEGLQAAEYMEKSHHVPYLKLRPYGGQACEDFFAQVAKVLDKKPRYTGIEEAQKYVNQVSRMTKDHEILLSGNLDFIAGMKPLLEEFGFDKVTSLVTHKKPKKTLFEFDDQMHFDLSEGKRYDLIKKTRPTLILGDAIINEFAKEFDIVNRQVSNPNLDYVQMHDLTPYVGVNGMKYLSELLMNMIMEYNRK